VRSYVSELCHKRRAEMNPQMIALYDLAQEIGKADFVAALELAAEQQMYGAEYIRAIGVLPSAPVPDSSAQLVLSPLPLAVPPQHEVERALAHYEQYVANRDSVGLSGAAREEVHA